MTAPSSCAEGETILLAVPTRDRPWPLARCIASLVADVPPSGTCVSLLVVDNGSSADALAANRAAVDWATAALPSRLVIETTSGVAAVRNRVLDEADALGADAVVFLDDDQTVAPGCLTTLVEVWRCERADAVKPVVVWAFDAPARHIAQFRPAPAVGPLRSETRSPVATCGVLMAGRLWRDLGLRFDPALNLSGGEDTVFFRQAVARGARLVLTRETFVVEHCPASRQRIGWLLYRAYRVGAVETAARIKDRSKAVNLLRGTSAMIYHGIVAMVMAPWPERALHHARRSAKAFGRIIGVFGVRPGEYAGGRPQASYVQTGQRAGYGVSSGRQAAGAGSGDDAR